MRHALSDHIIIVGFGRVGQAVAHSARELGATCVVIDRSSEREADIEAEGHIALIGDATEEKDLTEAGIHRARALVASAELDQVNLIVTLTARAMRPDLHIVSRVNEPSWRERMMRAGADVAESPYITYGMSLATAAQSKILLDVHRLPLLGFGTEEFVITSNSKLIGRTVEEIGRRHPGIFVVGLRREDQFHRWHELSGAILHGDILVALGDSDALLGLNAAQ